MFTNQPVLLDRNKSLLLIIDLQLAFLQLIPDNKNIKENCIWTVQLANEVKVQQIVIEQNSKKLGLTIPAIRNIVNETSIFDKIEFSCAHNNAIYRVIEQTGKKQIILIGIEAHVCIMQTALALKQIGYVVFTVADCIGSRSLIDKEIAMMRMQQAGIYILTKEMLLFEWLERADTDEFRHIQKNFLIKNKQL